MYKFSRYWNRFAYLFIRLGSALLWDYTKKCINRPDMETGYDVYSKTLKEILEDREN